MKKLFLILMLLPVVAPFASAQSMPNFISAEDAQRQELKARREAQSQFYGELIGKTFWYKPGYIKYSAHEFYLNAVAINKITSYKDKIFPQSVMKFEIIDCLQIGTNDRDKPEYTYKVRFQDGIEAFIRSESFGSFKGDIKHRFDGYSYNPGVSTKVQDAKSTRETSIFLEDPAVIIARHDQKERDDVERMEAEKAKIEKENTEQVAAEAKADAKRRKAMAMNAKKGGVSLGMSKKQVLASNWGKPNQINRTIWSGGTREQWVYGRASYLYFTNDILATIQN
jgi:hypothetical protein